MPGPSSANRSSRGRRAAAAAECRAPERRAALGATGRSQGGPRRAARACARNSRASTSDGLMDSSSTPPRASIARRSERHCGHIARLRFRHESRGRPQRSRGEAHQELGAGVGTSSSGLFKQLAQAVHREAHAGLHRSEGNAERLRDVGLRGLGEKGEGDHLRLFRRQLANAVRTRISVSRDSITPSAEGDGSTSSTG